MNYVLAAVGVLVFFFVVVPLVRLLWRGRKAKREEGARAQQDRPVPWEAGWSSRTATPRARAAKREEEFRTTSAMMMDPLFDAPPSLAVETIDLDPDPHKHTHSTHYDPPAHDSHSSSHDAGHSSSYDSSSSDSGGSSDGGSSSSD